jgi:hypothetical protein
MTPDETSLLKAIDEILRSEEVRAQIQPIVARVRADLAGKPDAVMAWEPIPLETFGGALPAGIQSAWVFILRAGVNTGAERHPNSHQRMMSFEASGDMQIRAGPESPWVSNILISDPAAPIERRWISIPRNVWHQPVVAKEADWVVVSFHTVPAAALIEERPDPGGTGRTKRMVYFDHLAI